MLILISSLSARAAVGVILYESKGADTRETGTGHIALITTTLCAAGIAHLRRCEPDEVPGAIITRYSNIAAGYGETVLVVPLQEHFTATRNASEVPILSNGRSLEAMQIEYWRRYLKPHLPPLSREQYNAILTDQRRFNGARIFRRAITLEYLVKLMGPRKKRYSTEPIAMIDPETQELIPDGRWREAVGVQQMRSAVIITVPTSPEREERLIKFLEQAPGGFNAMTNNCSDFTERALTFVLGDSGFKTRTRLAHVADVWISSPIAVTTDFLAYAKHDKVPLEVRYLPMIPGTRRTSASNTSISRGSLVPDASQGRLAFSVKVLFNFLTPPLGVTTLAVDEASHFSDVEKLIHERGTANLSRLSNAIALQQDSSPQNKRELKREQMKTFGTTSCWSAKKHQFRLLETEATKQHLLSAAEDSLLLRNGQPYLLPRLYEHLATAQGFDSKLLVGVQICVNGGCGSKLISSFLPTPAIANTSNRGMSGQVPARAEVIAMASSEDRSDQMTAFRLMTAVINYDLSSEVVHRRTSAEFDPDWQLYLNVAQKNALDFPSGEATRQTVSACSSGQFNSGSVQIDAFERNLSLDLKFLREVRGLLYGANR